MRNECEPFLLGYSFLWRDFILVVKKIVYYNFTTRTNWFVLDIYLSYWIFNLAALWQLMQLITSTATAEIIIVRNRDERWDWCASNKSSHLTFVSLAKYKISNQRQTQALQIHPCTHPRSYTHTNNIIKNRLQNTLCYCWIRTFAINLLTVERVSIVILFAHLCYIDVDCCLLVQMHQLQ